MKWFHYVACFFAGFFLIHLVPHLTHGLSMRNALGATISLVVGCLLLWAGRASVKRPWTLVWVLLGMMSVLLYGMLYANRTHRRGRERIVSLSRAGGLNAPKAHGFPRAYNDA